MFWNRKTILVSPDDESPTFIRSIIIKYLLTMAVGCVCALLYNFWRISLYVTDNAIAKLYGT